MRAPGEAPGLMALEIAMDEMAEKLGIDPVEFRILQRHAGRSREAGPAVLAAPAGRMPARSARSASAGPSATRSPARCATGAGWSAWAWRSASATTS